MKPRPNLVMLAGWCVLIVLLVGAIAACAHKFGIPEPADDGWKFFDSSGQPTLSGRDEARLRLRNAANAMGIIGGLCFVAAVVTLIASAFVPLIPRKTAWYCLAGAAMGLAAQYLLLVYGVWFAEIAVWVSIVVGVGTGMVVGLPWLVAWFRLRLLGKAKVLKEGDDLRAAVAMEATALPERFPDSAARKNRLVQLNDDRDRKINGGAS